MALITCPECENQVSDKAKNCPVCAYPINPEDLKNKINTPTPSIIV